MKLKPLYKNNLTVLFAFLFIALACFSQPVLSHGQKKIGKTVGMHIMQSLRQASVQGLKQADHSKNSPLQAIKGQSIQSKQKVEVIYLGADYCPYCAAIRWPLVMALQRFGSFKNLKYMRSSSDDVHANTPTFSFHGAHYLSQYIVFHGVEIKDRKGHRLTEPTSKEDKLVHQFDRQPYTNHPGAIPFLDIGGHYIEIGAPYNPQMLHGKSWQTIVQKLNNPDTHLSQRLIEVTNQLTAAICTQDGNKPKRICQESGVKKAAQALPKEHQKSS